MPSPSDPCDARGVTMGVPDRERTWERLRPHFSEHHVSLARAGAPPLHRRVDAALLFIDVTGFTRLTERLARHGPEGAEELTEIIDGVLDSQIEVVAGLDGDVVAFGGDALLALFEGPRREHRAVGAAVAAQAALEPFRRVTSTAGGSSIRASMGIETGPVDLVLAGFPTELAVVGGTVSTTLAMEARAPAGGIRVGPAATRALWSDRRRGAAGVLLGPDLLAAARWPVPQAPPGPLLGDPPRPPPAVFEHFADAEPEHRRVGVGFLAVGGLDAIAADDPFRLAADLDDVIRATQAACERHGVALWGTDVAVDGIKLILVSGAPVASGDHVDRMLAAVHDAVESTSLPVRAGVQAGRVFMSEVGGRSRRTWTVLGDPVNVAARLAALASEGGVLTTTTALAGTRAPWATTPPTPTTVKGRREPVDLVEVTHPGTRDDLTPEAATHGPTSGPALLGARADELARLLAALEDDLGEPVEVVGPAGIGKTHLVDAALTHLTTQQPHRRVVRVHATTYASNSSFLALRDPLRLLVTGRGSDERTTARALAERLLAVDRDLEPWLALIGEVWRVPWPESPEVEALDPAFRSAVRLRHAMAALHILLPADALVVVEDGHWLDAGSAELVRSLGQGPWQVLLTRRPSDHEVLADGPSCLVLEPLSADEALALVRAAAPGLVWRDVDEVVEHAEGNPLFLHELAVKRAGNDEAEELPATVQELFASRIDALPVHERTSLRQASVLGARAPEPLVRALVGAGVGALAGLLDFVDHHAVFRHDLLRQAAYEGLPYRVRRSLHAQVVDLILTDQVAVEREERADLLSFHSHQAGRYADSWRWSREAATAARARGSSTEAMRLLARAETAHRAAPGLTADGLREVLVDLAQVAEMCGSAEAALAALRRAARLPQSDCEAAEISLNRGRVLQRSDSVPRARRAYRTGLRRVRDVDTPDAAAIRARALALDGTALLDEGKADRAIPVLERAAALAEEIRNAEIEALARTYLVWALMDVETPEVAWPYADRALAATQRSGDRQLHAVALALAGGLARADDFDAAISFYARSREERLAIGDHRGAAIPTHNQGLVHLDRGELDPAERLIRETLEVWRPAGFLLGVTFATMNLASVMLARNRPEPSRTLLDEAEALIEDAGLGGARVELQLRRVHWELVFGSASEALAKIDSFRATFGSGIDRYLVAVFQLHAATAHCKLGSLAAARSELDDCIALCREIRSQMTLGMALRLRAAAFASAEDEREATAVLEDLGVLTTDQWLDPPRSSWLSRLAHPGPDPVTSR